MRTLGRLSALCAGLMLVFSAAGCANYEPVLHVSRLPGDQQAALAPASDYNMVTQRRVGSTLAGGDAADTVLCVSPSPDWATAWTRSLSQTLQGSSPNGPSGSASGSYSEAEAITLLSGRTAAVVALRDALYQACQAYANRQIGRAAYALILSQYGNVLTNIIGSTAGSGSTPAASAAGAAATPSQMITVSAAATPAAAPTSSGAQQATATGQGAAATNPVAIMQQQHLQALLVACLNTYDPTLPQASDPKDDRNVILRPAYCENLIQKFVAAAPELLKPPSGAPSDAPSAPKCSQKVTLAGHQKLAVVQEVQAVLRSTHDYAGAINGNDTSSDMTAALKAYQSSNKLCTSGIIDDATLSQMNVEYKS